MIFHLGDQIRRHQITTTGKNRVSPRNFERCEFCGAQGERKIRRNMLNGKTESLDIANAGAHTHFLQKPHRHQIAGMYQPLAERRWSVESAGVVLRPPHLALGALRVFHRCVVDDRSGGISVIESRRIEKRLEARARLTTRLKGTVERTFHKIESADQCQDTAVTRTDADHGALNLRHLRQHPLVPDLTNPDDIPSLQNIRRSNWIRPLSIITHPGTRPAHVRPGQCCFALARDLHPRRTWLDLQHHSGTHTAHNRNGAQTPRQGFGPLAD